MGSSGSKAVQQTVRKFPTRAPGSAPPAAPRPSLKPSPGQSPDQPAASQPRSAPQASFAKDEAIRADSVDPNRPDFITPEFAERLHKMGIVQPNPTYSPSSTASPFSGDASGIRQSLSKPQFPPATKNTTLGALEARRRIEAQANEELEHMGKSTDQGKQFLDITTIKQILVLRDRGVSAADIESRLRLRPGVVARLGPKGIVSAAS
ncbi:hypothetical protein VTK26DRAFT_8173 [Humicola hyalothermophila]